MEVEHVSCLTQMTWFNFFSNLVEDQYFTPFNDYTVGITGDLWQVFTKVKFLKNKGLRQHISQSLKWGGTSIHMINVGRWFQKQSYK
jgi:hypothetical protein